jgi:GT2 family glycosyltransferase
VALSSTVIVVSYRPGSWLAPCVQSALGQAAEVVVVDNGSHDHEASRVARSLGARVVRSEVNLGFAGGVNLGLPEARGEMVALLNDDARAGSGWLDAAARVLSDPLVAAVTPKVLLDGVYAEVAFGDEPWQAPGDARHLGRQLRTVTVDGIEVLGDLVGGGVHDVERGPIDGGIGTWRWTSGRKPFYVPVPDASADPALVINGERVQPGPLVRVLNHAGSFLRSHGIAGEYGLGAPDDGRFDQQAERFGFSGTAPVFRADTLRRLGGFASRFFAYNEDTDWCLRARLAGLRIVYDPRAVVTHQLSATSGGPREAFVRFLARRNSLLCLARNAPADVAREHLVRRVREGPGEGVRRAVLTNLPWAVATRLAMHRLWAASPRQVWDAWADQDRGWDDSPAARGLP